MTGSWANWAGNQTATCTTVRPRGTELDRRPRWSSLPPPKDGGIKPIGSGHSFSGIGRPEEVQMLLDRHAVRGLAWTPVSGLVTVQAGMPLYRLNSDAGRGPAWALTNLGDVDRQTVAGALATGTHGTGAAFGGLATQLRGSGAGARRRPGAALLAGPRTPRSSARPG